jgi:3-oxoacyl-[acyl-carrier protein] reductase
MDLGISGRTAIVCGASAGLGRGAGRALAREGVRLIMAARGEERLLRTADEIAAETGASVTTVVCDVTTEAGRAALLEACPSPDILINNAAGPPAGDFRSFSHQDWIAAVEANMLAAIFLIRAMLDGMIERRFGRVVNITSSAVKAPIANLALSNAARAGLTGFIGGLARQVAAHNVTLNSVLPGQFDTDRLRSLQQRGAEAAGAELQAFRERQMAQIPAKRFGDPDEFGEVCAFLCGARSGFITGQNLLIDGGQFPGLL